MHKIILSVRVSVLEHGTSAFSPLLHAHVCVHTHTHTHQTTGSEDFELQKAFVSEMVRIFLFVPIITA